MTTVSRPALSLATLGRLPQEMRPALDPGALSIGVVHLGLGAFHRAHQAVYTEVAAERSGEHGWGICGVSQRSAGAADVLSAQDGLYSVLCLGPDDRSVRVVGSLRSALFAQRDSEALNAALAAPEVKVVTLTVTEKGYRYSSGDRRLQTADPELLADAAGRPAVTVLGQLARGLERRKRAGAGPLTVVPCDNISANGELVGQLVRELLSLPGGRFEPGLADWVDTNVRFPCTMVDRIVPATTERWREEASGMLGLTDMAPVVTEPFSQWVVQDEFAAARPAWELAGADLVEDVAPYEALKLRALNGTHSALAYLGLLSGAATIAEALRHPELEGFVRRMLHEEVRPTLDLPPGVSFGSYRDSVLSRFANASLPYRCSQVATDGSQKLPQRVLGTVRDSLARGVVPRTAVTVVAAWLLAVRDGRDDKGGSFEVSDPLGVELRRAMGTADGAARAVAGALTLPQVFGDDLAGDDRFADALTERFDALARAGALSVASDLAAGR